MCDMCTYVISTICASFFVKKIKFASLTPIIASITTPKMLTIEIPPRIHQSSWSHDTNGSTGSCHCRCNGDPWSRHVIQHHLMGQWDVVGFLSILL